MLKESISGFDQIMYNEEPEGSIILVVGSPGTLKSTFMFTTLMNYTKRTGTKGLYITLEQSKERHLSNLKNMGFDEINSVDVIDYNYSRKLSNIQGKSGMEFEWVIDSMSKYHEQVGKSLSCLAIDSLNALYALVDTIKDRGELYFFFEKLRRLKTTTFIAAEVVEDVNAENILIGSEKFLCDGIIELGTMDIENKVKRYLQMRKMRGVKHNMNRFSIEVKPGEGVVVLGELII